MNWKKILGLVAVGVAVVAGAYIFLNEEGGQPRYDFSKTHKAVFKPVSEINESSFHGEIPLISEENYSQRWKDDPYYSGPGGAPEQLIKEADREIKHTENSPLAVADTVQDVVQEYNEDHGIYQCRRFAEPMARLTKEYFSELGLDAWAMDPTALIENRWHAEVAMFDFSEGQLYIPYSFADGIPKFEESFYKNPEAPIEPDTPPENLTLSLEYNEMKERIGPENAKKMLTINLLGPFDVDFCPQGVAHTHIFTMGEETAQYLASHMVGEGPDNYIFNLARKVQGFLEYYEHNPEPAHWVYPRGKLIAVGEGENLTLVRTFDEDIFNTIRRNENQELENRLENLYLQHELGQKSGQEQKPDNHEIQEK